MPTSQTGALAEILSGGSLPLTGDLIPQRQLAYFRERLKGRIFSFIVGAFKKQQREDVTITQAAIARRLGRRPEQINRWLSGPSNMTAETISDLVLAICGGEPSLGVAELHATSPRQTVTERQVASDNVPPPESLTADVLNLEATHAPDNQPVEGLDRHAGNEFPLPYYVDINPAMLSEVGAPCLAINDPFNQQIWMTAISQLTMAMPLQTHSLYRLPSPSYPAASGVSLYGTVVSQQDVRTSQLAQQYFRIKSALIQREESLAHAQKEKEELLHENEKLRQSLAVRISGARYWRQEATGVHLGMVQQTDIAMDSSGDTIALARAGQIGFSA